MLNVNYNFYYHLNEHFPKNKIIEYIKNKDYDNFIREYNKWGRDFLPQYANAYADDDYEHMVDTDITQKWNFEQITFSEYECG